MVLYPRSGFGGKTFVLGSIRFNWESIDSRFPHTIVLLSKSYVEYHGIGLVEVICKFIAIIVDWRLVDSIEFHNVLHGFRYQRGTGTAMLEEKMRQKIVDMRQAVLYYISLSLCKAHDAMDWGHTL